MAWMTDPHAAQILRGLYPDQYAGWWKIWLRYGFVVLLAGIAAGGTLLKMRPSSPIAPGTPEVGAAPKPTITFPSLFNGRPAPNGLEEPGGRDEAEAFEVSPADTETGYSAP
jgi:hypothetical protein